VKGVLIAFEVAALNGLPALLPPRRNAPFKTDDAAVIDWAIAWINDAD
jgi:hypothetical protein